MSKPSEEPEISRKMKAILITAVVVGFTAEAIVGTVSDIKKRIKLNLKKHGHRM